MTEPVERDRCKYCGKDLASHIEDRGASCPDIGGRGVKLDMRYKLFMWDGAICFGGEYTDACSGCFEAGEYMGQAHHYEHDDKAGCYVGAGCHECGHTGKRRNYVPVQYSFEKLQQMEEL